MTRKIFDTSGQKAKVLQSFALVIAAGLALIIGFLFSQFCCFEGIFSNKVVLEGKINPNNASLESLLRLPGIGFSRANAIITYRREFLRQYPEQLAFKHPNDLQKIKGIGPKTVANIKAFIRLETDEF